MLALKMYALPGDLPAIAKDLPAIAMCAGIPVARRAWRWQAGASM